MGADQNFICIILIRVIRVYPRLIFLKTFMSAVLPIQYDEIISYNPATGAEVGRVPQMSADEVKAAVESSRRAFQNWKKTSFNYRASYIMRAREVISPFAIPGPANTNGTSSSFVVSLPCLVPVPP